MNTSDCDSVVFSTVTAADFDELAALRIAAMRDSLERVGRFDLERARERLRKSFYPEHTRFVILDGQRIGFYTFLTRVVVSRREGGIVGRGQGRCATMFRTRLRDLP